MFPTNFKEKGAFYLPDAVRDGPGEEDPGQDLESSQDDRRRHNSWKMREEDDNVRVGITAHTSNIKQIRNTVFLLFLKEH